VITFGIHMGLVISGLRMQKFLCIITLLFCFLESSYAQNFSNDIHLVKKGETLYSISKKYDISQQELIDLNPGIDSGLREGTELRIRKSNPIASSIKNETNVGNDAFHIVSAGDTWYSISKKYGIAVSQLKAANGQTGDELKINQKIQIPYAGQKDEAIPGDTSLYSIAYMLPFYTDAPDSLIKKNRKYQRASIQFYRGAMVAIQQMEAYGLRANINFYDVHQDSNSVKTALNTLDGNHLDICIGPLFKESITRVLSNSNFSETHLVMPVQQPSRLLLLKKNLSKVVPGASTQWAYLASHLLTNETEGCAMLHYGKDDEVKLLNSFHDEWKRLGGGDIHKFNISDTVEIAQWRNFLTGNSSPVIIMPCADVGRVRKFIGDYRAYNLTIYGNEIWLPISDNNIEPPSNFRVYGLSPEYIDMRDRKITDWIENYRITYKSEPDEFAFLGYDVSIFYLSGLKQFGREFRNQLNSIKAPMISHVFDFVSTGVESGFENRHTEIIGLTDDGLLKILNE